jgi:alpha-tubulin suppressor-like RCC1 family protein
MSRRARKPVVRGAHLSLWLAAVLLSATSCGDDRLTAPTDPKPAEPSPASFAAANGSLVFNQVSLGDYHSCGVTTGRLAYCWGYNAGGQLGDGTKSNHHQPVAVGGGLQFVQVTAGYAQTCGVAADSTAYCWGSNYSGQLGDGTTTEHSMPARVAGGRRFSQLSAGDAHVCGVTYPDGRAYCWGWNGRGQLGDGTTSMRVKPVAVLGGYRFRQIGAGYQHTCGVTTTNRVFCWGWNRYGQIGDSTTVVQRLVPSRVASGRSFRQVDAGRYHSCAVTTGDRAFCWGNGRSGQLGDGKTILRYTPRAVAGGLSFSHVSTGYLHTCGETTTNQAYCWGTNYYGQLGDGTTGTVRLTPVAVAGGLAFSQVSAGLEHTCGKTPAGVAYCWGWNGSGQLGDGSAAEQSSTPVAVADLM